MQDFPTRAAHDLEQARQAALALVLGDTGFAQVTTIDQHGYPVARTMTAFLQANWSVELVQRRVHQRLAQWHRDPRTLVTWLNSPAPSSTNERPHVFDLGLLVPRVVFVRGTAQFLTPEDTVHCYQHHFAKLSKRGLTRAPERDPNQVVDELVGVRVHPVRIRLEGFGSGPQVFQWTNESQRTDNR